MALLKPIALTKQSFDATKSEIFYFLSSGETQVVKNRLTIVDNESNQVVFQNTKSSFSFEQTLEENTLENNKQYYYYFNTYDINDNMSENSNSVFFTCYDTPILTLTNVEEGDVINASNYNFTFQYNQAQNRPLDYVEIFLYDINDNLISKSNQIRGLEVPLNFTYNFGGFENNTSYRIQASGITQDKVRFNTDIIDFSIIYIYPTSYSILDLENKCEEGYTQVSSNLILVEGIPTPSPAEFNYKNQELGYGVKLNLPKSNVVFNDGFLVGNDFVMTMKLSIINLKDFCALGDKNNGFILNLKRAIPFGETEIKDFVELYGYENGVKKVYLRSNYINPINSNCVIDLFLKKVGNVYTLIISEIIREDSRLEWNGYSNVEYFALTNLFWEENETTEIIPHTVLTEDINIFPIRNITLSNGIFYDFRMTKDININVGDIIDWNYFTIFIFKFEQDLLGGNIQFNLDNIKYLKIRKRLKSTHDWISIYQKQIITEDDFGFSLQDYLEPNNTDIEYALIPILSDGTEGEYIINSTTTKYQGIFILDSDKSYKIETSALFLNGQSVQTTGILYPINAKYPTIINNSKNNYQTETLQFMFCGFDFYENKVIDKNKITLDAEELEQFLKNKKPKIIKGYNNEIKLVNVVGNIVKNKNVDNNTYMFSINYVTQGEYNNKEDLQELGFIDVIS